MNRVDFKLEDCLSKMSAMETWDFYGKVTRVVGLIVEARLPDASLGGLCSIYASHEVSPVFAEVVGFKEESVLLMPLGDIRGVRPGSRVKIEETQAHVPVGDELLGRVLDGMGSPIDGKGAMNTGGGKNHLYKDPPDPVSRRLITEPLDMGVKSINTFTSCGEGQRMSIIAGSGVGKSVLLSMMARNTNADINVIALIGERGREVREFIDKNLGEEGLKNSVLVVVTSDQSPLLRMRGAFVATAIAEYFRDCGHKVLFMMDSVTRFAMAQREIGLAVGEPPTTKGYTPSVFNQLPKLLERAGKTSGQGSITGIYTVLVDQDDINDPVGDAVRSIVDGHIMLSRELSSKNHYPAVDVLESVSRVMNEIVDDKKKEVASYARDMLATYSEAEDLINIGAYVEGSNKKIDESLEIIEELNSFLKQDMYEKVTFEESWNRIFNIVNKVRKSQSGDRNEKS